MSRPALPLLMPFARLVVLLLLCTAAPERARIPASNEGLTLMQTKYSNDKLVATLATTPIQSGDKIFLKVARTGHRLAAQPDGAVHAQWKNKGDWEQFTIQKKSGGGDILPGDAVFLLAWTGKPITVGGWREGRWAPALVHAKWDHRGEWQQMTIETNNPEDGAVGDGDEIYLKAWTGACVDADAPDAPGVAQARWEHKGWWQKLVVEAAELPTTTLAVTMPTTAPATPPPSSSQTPSATTAAPIPSTEEVTTTPAVTMPTTAPATPAPSSSETPSATAAPTPATDGGVPQCIQKQSLGRCERCLKSEQCGDGRYCCPYMKRCVAHSRDPCPVPVARCSPMCYDSMDNSQCRCAAADFPDKWQQATCTDPAGEEGERPATTAPPSPEDREGGSGDALLPESTRAPEQGDGMPTGTEAPPSTGGGGGETVSAQAWEHFGLVNELRAQGFTCPGGDVFAPNPVPLKFDCRLWTASRLHSEDMARQNYFSHNSKDGRTPWQRAEAAGTQAHGENIAAGGATAADALEQWKNSDGHCKNMMKASFQVMAVGYAYGAESRYKHYWTQMFSVRDAVDDSCYPAGAALGQQRSQRSQRSPLASSGDDAAEFVIGEALSRPPAN